MKRKNSEHNELVSAGWLLWHPTEPWEPHELAPSRSSVLKYARELYDTGWIYLRDKGWRVNRVEMRVSCTATPRHKRTVAGG